MGRKSLQEIPQSGIPGLVWRQRGPKGSWVVSLNVPRALKGRIVNSVGKPLTRLERSTGTRLLSQAKRLYPELMSALRAELEDRAGKPLETPVARATRGIANRYVAATSEQTISELEAFRAESLKAWRETRLESIDRSDIPGDFKDQLIEDLEYEEEFHEEWAENQWLNMRVRLPMREAIDAMPGLSEQEKRNLCASLDSVLIKAKQEIKAKRADPYFYEPSPQDQKLRESAEAPLPATIDEALRYKKQEVNERTYINILGSVKKWKKLIGSSTLDSITTSNLNKFARDLKKAKNLGGEGYSNDAANGSATRVRSLIKSFNVHQENDDARLPIPSWDHVKLTTDEKKREKVKVKAISIDDQRKLLNYAFSKDQQVWRAILLLSNTTFRIGELMSLKWRDLKHLDGIPYFDLQDSKTVEGIRRHPLNSRLQKHLMPLRGADGDYIIDAWQSWARPESGLSRWLLAAKRELDIEGKANAHSFRHASGGDLGYNLPEHTKKKLMGHSGGMTDRYTREDMKALSKAVEYIGFDF